MIIIWTLVGIIAPGLLAVGFGFLSMTPPDFKTARGLCWTAFGCATLWAVVWMFLTTAPVATREWAVLGLGILNVFGLPMSLFYIGARERLFVPPPTPASALHEAAPVGPPAPVIHPPAKPVDLRGTVLELYIQTFDEAILMSKTYVVMKVQVVNHGNDEAAAVKCSLEMVLGTWQSTGTVINTVPTAWRIKKKREGSFLATVYDEHPLEPLLRASQVYKKGHPCTGWLAFETYAYGDSEFPNVEFDVILTDSLGGVHHIKRQPGVYPRTGELVRLEQSPIPPVSLPKVG